MTKPQPRSCLIKGARLLDPAGQTDRRGYLVVRDGRIEKIGQRAPGGRFDETIDADGLWLMPGIVDLSARLREPGAAHKATIASESAAALAGGITTLCLPPDTDPVIDSPAVVDWLRGRVQRAGGVRVLPLGALTKGLGGESLSEMAALAAAGCVGVSQALSPIGDSLLMRRALEYAMGCGLAVHVIAMDPKLAGSGCAHEGAVATRLGLASIPRAAETAALAQWLALVEQTGARVHFGRLTSARAVEMIAAVAEAGLPVTADVAVHHLFLTDEALDGFDARAHVLPPLRAAEDRDALRRAVADARITAVCSDHQPHEADAKTDPLPLTAPGISGLDSLLGLMLDLVHAGLLSPLACAERLCSGPAAVIGRSAALEAGAAADLALIDPDAAWTLRAASMQSAGHNTPFEGRALRGQVRATWVDGRQLYRADAP